MRLFLLKFAAEGNSVIAFLDEGCGKEEKLDQVVSRYTVWFVEF